MEIISKKSSIINKTTNCYELKEGYFFEHENLIYKPCYISCKYCDINGNETEHNCIQCKEEYNIEFKLKGYKNCFIENEFNDINRVELIQNMKNNLFEILVTSKIDCGKDEVNIIKNISVIMTSTKNQKNKENDNNITIDLCECENILKDEYNISKNNSLYILQIISPIEGMKIPKIDYEVYYPIYDNNLTKLNLTLCKGTKIEISIPVKINDNIDKYNPKSGYYNDDCSKTTSESGTDISLKDRRNEFVENNMTLCEGNCDLINYNYRMKK